MAAERTPSGRVAPRSLADDLRGRSDEQLAALLLARPDLVNPVPADLGQLANRATTRPSVARALDQLDQFTLQVLDVLLLLPDPAEPGEAAALLGVDPAPARATITRLWELALVWGSPETPRVVSTLRQAVPFPAGLGPPADTLLRAYPPQLLREMAADLGRDAPSQPRGGAPELAALVTAPERIDAALEEVGPEARGVVERLVWGPPVGRVGQAGVVGSRAAARTPVERLLARGLLMVTDPVTVALPREVALWLRGGRPHRSPAPTPPALALTAVEPSVVDRAASGAAFETLRRVEDLLEGWSVEPPPVLRTGGLGVRELRRAAQRLDVDDTTAALLIEVSYAAGLIGASGELGETWLPTPAFDAWLADPPARRWIALARAWLETTRVPGLVGTRDEREKVVNALAPDLDRPGAPGLRAGVLAALAEAPPGQRASAESLEALLRWRLPRRGGSLRERVFADTVREAEILGVTGRGALAAASRALLGAEDDEGAERLLAALLPEPVDHVLLQADLTAVAPGPLTTALGHELALLAEVESRGAATVYRFTEASVRRAFDAGRSAAEVHALLARHSSTPVPQPLSYLVDDVARRHGKVRVGSATAFVRCDDEAVLARLLAEKGAAQLRLRRLAPTVLAAQSPPELVLERLRALGYAPAAESADGAMLVRRPDARRSPPRARPRRLTFDPPEPGPTLLAAAVRALRAGDHAVTSVRRHLSASGRPVGSDGELDEVRSSMAETLGLLRDAVVSGAPVWIGYVNAEGGASRRVVEPLKVQGGFLTAYDHRREQVRTFAVHRITGAAPID